MSFNTSESQNKVSGNTTEDFTQTFNFSPEKDEILSVDEIRCLLKLPEGNSLDSYDDVHTIGIGGFGAVYAAKEPGLERKLALKILRPRYRQQPERVKAFIREARITAQIDHPNIVPVHRIGVFEDAGVFFSMKRIGGETLRAILRKLQENRPGYREKYNLSRLVDIFLGACQGVSYAHQNGILHCDLKPENLMVGNFGEVLVMDWGMARYLPEEDSVGNAKTDDYLQAGASEEIRLGGTPVFMAPEHLSLSSNNPTVRSDVYAMGCILYAILTWKSSPFEGVETLEEIQKQVVQGKLVSPRRCAPESQEVPRELEAICLKAMARNPEKRYANVAELIEDLRKYRDGLPVNAYSPSFVYKFGKFIFRHPLVPTVLFIALLVWCGFSLYTFFNEQLYIEYLRTSAVTNFRNGEKRLIQAKSRNGRLKNGTNDAADMRAIETAIASDAADAEADFKTAMTYLVRIPKKYRNEQNFVMLSKTIFRELIGFYKLTRNDKKFFESARFFQNSWSDILAYCRKLDPGFDKLFRQAVSGKGVLNIEGDVPAEKWHIEDASGKKIVVADDSRKVQDKKLILQIPVGYYTVVSKSCGKHEIRIPVRISLTSEATADIGEVCNIPEGMVFVPSGEFFHAPELSNNYSRSSHEKSFFIKRHEVTVGEYLEFWKKIKDPEQKKQYASYYFNSINSLISFRSWDDNGKLLRPGLTLKHPVSGISGTAAEAFCHYMSGKLKRKVLLTTRSQWSKAAGGIDGLEYVWGNTYKAGAAGVNTGKIAEVGSYPEDLSVYGALDLTGNVREFVKVPFSKKSGHDEFAIAGGSYYTSPKVAGNSSITYFPRGGNDIGFRYVMPLEGTGRTPVKKND
ncbi:MAG: protein kinase [Lentisphaeria bacterium]|nr:protein kinase [Lentisphaeria bacterium]